MTRTDGHNIQYTKEQAEIIANKRYKEKITYEESLKKDMTKYNGGEWWGECIPEIVSQQCPIPYMPNMPLTRCLDCESEYRKSK